MHHIALLLMFCTFMALSHIYAFVIDPTEQEHEELQEQAPVEGANPEPEQGKPRCI
jgi:hypothetical protein